MAATIWIETDTLAVTPTKIEASQPPTEIWLEYELTNVGDEDGSSTNFYYTVDGPNGCLHSDFVPDDTIAVDESAKHYIRIEGSLFQDLFGDYWIALRTADGEVLGSIFFEVEAL